MVYFCKSLPDLRVRYSTSYGVPIWKSRVTGRYFARCSRGFVVCVDSDSYFILENYCRAYKREHLSF